jgi:hypothetical protein
MFQGEVDENGQSAAVRVPGAGGDVVVVVVDVDVDVDVEVEVEVEVDVEVVPTVNVAVCEGKLEEVPARTRTECGPGVK